MSRRVATPLIAAYERENAVPLKRNRSILAFATTVSVVLLQPALAQVRVSSTFAGDGLQQNVPATSVGLAGPAGVVSDAAGNLFIALKGYNTVVRLDGRTGVLTTIAGNGFPGFSGDEGPAINATLWGPTGLALSEAGDLYVADSVNNRIRKISGGVITTVAGGGSITYPAAGAASTSATLYYPTGIALDGAGDLFIAEPEIFAVRKVSNGVITPVAGSGQPGYSGDNGLATSARLQSPSGVAVDSNGDNVYIADTYNSQIRKVVNGVITTVPGFGADSRNLQAFTPFGITLDAAGNLYASDTGNQVIWEISAGTVKVIAGNGTLGLSGDGGSATSTQLRGPYGITVSSSGTVYFSDSGNSVVRAVSGGIISTVAGNGSFSFGGDNGPATSAQLDSPHGVAVDTFDNVYFVDSSRVREVSSGMINTIVGTGVSGYNGDNAPAIAARLNDPEGIAIDANGDVYIADSGNARIRKVSGGTITTVAGTGIPGFSGDSGPAISAQLFRPVGIAVDRIGNLYIADTFNNRIRMVSQGQITTIAGDGFAGYSGDGGPATAAHLSGPQSIAVDAKGNLYIADSGNYLIRQVSNDVITTIAGNTVGFCGCYNGPALGRQTAGIPDHISGIALDADGNLYFTDPWGASIGEISGGWLSQNIEGSTIEFGTNAGVNYGAFICSPCTLGVAADSRGNLYTADPNNHRITITSPGSSPFLNAVTSAASGVSGPIVPVAPGAIAVAHGSGFGPTELTVSIPDVEGFLPTELAGTSVFVDGHYAPIIYVSATLVAFVVPYDISAECSVIEVRYQGQSPLPKCFGSVSAIPGLFTLDSSGSGQAAAINSDGSVNSVCNPARVGSLVSLYATGVGQTSPSGIDGKLTSAPLPQPVLPVTATVGGQPAVVEYAGAAPGEVAGLLEINVRIPAGIRSGGAVAVFALVGGMQSQPDVTIAVSGN